MISLNVAFQRDGPQIIEETILGSKFTFLSAEEGFIIASFLKLLLSEEVPGPICLSPGFAWNTQYILLAMLNFLRQAF